MQNKTKKLFLTPSIKVIKYDVTIISKITLSVEATSVQDAYDASEDLLDSVINTINKEATSVEMESFYWHARKVK